MATVPLIAIAGVIQMSMLNGGYGDEEVGIAFLSRLSPLAVAAAAVNRTRRERERKRERRTYGRYILKVYAEGTH